MRLEDLRPNSAVRGVHPDGLVTVVSVQWFGSAALELTYKTPDGTVANELLYRDAEDRLEIVAAGRPWSFDGDGALFRLVSEAQRIRLAHLFDPLLAVHTSVVDPLPHQIDHRRLRGDAAASAAALPPGRRPGRRQDHHGRPAHQGADRPRRPGALPHRLPRQPRRTVAGRALPKVPASVRDPDQRQARSRPHPQLVSWRPTWSSPVSTSCPATRMCSRSCRRPTPARTWSCATRRTSCRRPFFGGEVKYTKRYRLGQLLSGLTRHFLLMTATPHNGKEQDFQLFLALLDGDRFEGRFRDGVHAADVSDLMRRMVKERLLKFDGKPLFPERIAYTVPYRLSDEEAHLYTAVTDYVREEFNRAEALANAKRAGTVGFALTILQRRLASSPISTHDTETG